MTPVVRQRAAAKLDLVDHFVYLAETAGQDVADCFLSNAEKSFADLAKMPRMGSPLRGLLRDRSFGCQPGELRASPPNC